MFPTDYPEAIAILEEVAEITGRIIRMRPWDARDLEDRRTALARQLEDVHPFAEGKNRMVNMGHYGACIYQGSWVAYRAVNEGADPKSVVQAAGKLLAENVGTFRRIYFLHGIEGTFDRTFGDLRVRSRSVEERLRNELVGSSISSLSAATDLLAGATLEIEYQAPLFTISISDGYNSSPEHAEDLRVIEEQDEVAQKLLAALVLSSDAPANLAGAYTVAMSDQFPVLAGSLSPRALSFTVSSGQRLDLDLMVATFEKIKRMSTNDWKAFRTAIERLSRSRIPFNPETSSIDMMIALEVLTTFKDTAKGDIGYRLKTRTSMLISRDHEERKEIAAIVTKLYDARSKAAHEGTIRKPHEFAGLRDRGDAIIVRVAQQVLERGGFPNWDDLLFTQTPPSNHSDQ